MHWPLLGTTFFTKIKFLAQKDIPAILRGEHRFCFQTFLTWDRYIERIFFDKSTRIEHFQNYSKRDGYADLLLAQNLFTRIKCLAKNITVIPRAENRFGFQNVFNLV